MIEIDDIKDIMNKNWKMTCDRLLGSGGDSDIPFEQEQQVLSIITKNVYHKKPSILPIEFVEVSVAYLHNCIVMIVHHSGKFLYSPILQMRAYACDHATICTYNRFFLTWIPKIPTIIALNYYRNQW